MMITLVSRALACSSDIKASSSRAFISFEQEYEKRKQLKEEWERWVNKWKRDHEEQMRRDREASDLEEAEQVEAEELLDVTEEILPDVGIFLIRSVVS
ncbi:hypothetical protein Hanom_Chr01g00065241 [Helianthus anomalus]